MTILRTGSLARLNRRGRRGLVPLLLAVTLAAACDVPFDPFQENTIGPFAIYGTLDLNADTQWVRVMPIRQLVVSDSAPIDAVVTLEHLGTGRVVMLTDSLFRYVDPVVGGVGYAHNFWTTEPIEPDATYRLTAETSDGEATTALVETPPALVVTLVFLSLPRTRDQRLLRQFFVEAEHLLYADLLYTVWDPRIDRGGEPFRERRDPSVTSPGSWRFGVPGVDPIIDRLDRPPLIDMFRREVEIAVAGSDWPYEPRPATDGAIPEDIPTTVENGIGAVVGVATRTFPLVFCDVIEPRSDGTDDCTTVLDASSASIEGEVIRDPCGDPMVLPVVRVTERFADGGAVVWKWPSDWDGSYHFQGLEPGSEFLLQVGGDTGVAWAVAIPPLDPGERYTAPTLDEPDSC